MTKKEKARRLLELWGFNNDLEKIKTEFEGDGLDDSKFNEFACNTLMLVHMQVFSDDFSEIDLDNLISIFSKPDLAKSLMLLEKLSDKALRISDEKVQRYIQEIAFEDYAQYGADKKEKN